MNGDDTPRSQGSDEPTPGTDATLQCGVCGATFPRHEAATEDGTLACPECGSTAVTDTTRR